MPQSKKSNGSSFFKVFAITLVSVLVIGAVAEVGTRFYVAHRVKQEFEQVADKNQLTMRSEPETSFGATSVVWGGLRQNLSELNLTIPSTLDISYENNDESRPVVKGQPQVRLTAHDLSGWNSDGGYELGELHAETVVPPEMLLSEIRKATQVQRQNASAFEQLLQGAVSVTRVTPNPESQSLQLELNGGLASINVAPSVQNGEIVLDIQDGSILGINLPGEFLNSVEQSLSESVNALNLGGLKVSDLKVVSGGLEASVHGTNVHVNSLTEAVSHYTYEG